MQAAQGEGRVVARQAGLQRRERQAGGGEFLRAMQAGEEAARIGEALERHARDARQFGRREFHGAITSRRGSATTQRPPQSAIRSVWARISSMRFHGRTTR